jgi:hypothetical protein
MKPAFDFFDYDEDMLEQALESSFFFLKDNWRFLESLGFEFKTQCAMIDVIIKFFSDKEEYEKCSELLDIKNKIIGTYEMLPGADSVSSSSLK